eukprot:COSAG02_NODE_236_length_27740_cov_49.156073_9_plen_382_part_00
MSDFKAAMAQLKESAAADARYKHNAAGDPAKLQTALNAYVHTRELLQAAISAPGVRDNVKAALQKKLDATEARLKELQMALEETAPITLILLEITGATFRLPASPADTVGDVESALEAASGRAATECRLVWKNKKLNDDGATLAELGITAGEVPLDMVPQDPVDGKRLRREAKVAALDANVAAAGVALAALPSRMMLCYPYTYTLHDVDFGHNYEMRRDKHMRYFRFVVGTTVEMSWGKKADGSNQSAGALAWCGCGSAPPKRRTVTGVKNNSGGRLRVSTDRGDVFINLGYGEAGRGIGRLVEALGAALAAADAKAAAQTAQPLIEALEQQQTLAETRLAELQQKLDAEVDNAKKEQLKQRIKDLESKIEAREAEIDALY